MSQNIELLYIYIYTHTHIHIYTHKYMYIYIHAYTSTYTHRQDAKVGLTRGEIDMRHIIPDVAGACVVINEPNCHMSKVGETPDDNMIREIYLWATGKHACMHVCMYVCL